jgi:hypothetical protein
MANPVVLLGVTNTNNYRMKLFSCRKKDLIFPLGISFFGQADILQQDIFGGKWKWRHCNYKAAN